MPARFAGRRGNEVGANAASPTSDPARDAALVKLVRTGDTAAFEELYRTHLPAVRRTVSAELRDHQVTPDVVQEAFTRALDCLPSLRDPSRFRPWLLSIARHVAADHVRARSRTPVASEDDDGEMVADTPGPAEMAELADLAQLVRSGMAELSPRDATAVALVTHLGLSPNEVGAALGVTTGAAKVIVHRARRRLRAALLLEVLVRGHAGGCPDRPSIGPDGDRAAALRHVLACPECTETLTAEVRGYDSRPESLEASSRR
jgi:RNA polymerase sigma factor (sigma-70 family)